MIKDQMDKMSASEAIFGFAAWLTTRENMTVMSSAHNCVPVMDRIKEFCDTNKLPDPRDGWEKNLTHPKEASCQT